MDRAAPLWAITSYFNPVGYRTRRANYRTFRRRLGVPLLTVEWSTDGRFELTDADADVLIQVRSPDVMWQKERLLDLGLRALPTAAESVAWLDCDVVFRDADWSRRAQRELESAPLVQLFSRCHFLGSEDSLEAAFDAGTGETNGEGEGDVAESLVHMSRQPGDDASRHELLWTVAQGQGPITRRRRLSGLAWAGRRELLERHGFYDACILGAGDRAFACAAFGQQRAQQAWMRTPQQREHYLRWADPFAGAVGGRVGLVEGDLVHLWHGRIENRQYRVRHAAVETHGFDPATDIARDPDTGTWRWTGANDGLRRALERFFRDRREDTAEDDPPDPVTGGSAGVTRRESAARDVSRMEQAR